MFKKIFNTLVTLSTRLPLIEVEMIDWYIGFTFGKRYGFVVGPKSLSLTKDNEISFDLIRAPHDYEPPLSDVYFKWNSKRGIVALKIPSIDREMPDDQDPYRMEYRTYDPLRDK